MKTGAYLGLRIQAGTRIGEAARAMVRVADLLDIPVEAEFNNGTLIVTPGSTVTETVESYRRHSFGSSEIMHRPDDESVVTP